MNLFFPGVNAPQSELEARLMKLAAGFLFLYSLILTLSQAVRVHSWNTTYRWVQWIGFLVWLAGFALIYRRVNHYAPEHDPFLLPIAGLLTGWGILTIYRLDTTLGLRQTVWLAVGLLVIELGMHFSQVLNLLRRYKYIWLTAGLLLIVLTFVFGKYPGGVGPRLWLGCCGLYFQPSEPLKLLLVIYLAAYLADKLPVSYSLGQLLTPTLVVTGAAALLLVAQRDLGTATLVVAIYTLVVFMASGRRRILIICGVALVAAVVAGYLSFDVIRLRVDAWLNPWANSANRSYQIVQSLISIAAGGLIGSGPGLGSPGLVPLAHSDFIASAITEETGLMGILAIILLFTLLCFRGLRIGIQAPNLYQRLLAFGISIYFGLQAILILGGNFRLLPLTGVTLPFVSYGGSSLLISFVSLTLLLLIGRPEEPPPLPALHPSSYLATSGLLLCGFGALGLIAGWWGVIRSDGLLARTDNLRWIIDERFVPRGSLLDRRSQDIAVTVGTPGNYTRSLLYPPLSTTIGYANSTYGKSGLEDTLNAYLSGQQGVPASTYWLSRLIYTQPPNGLDIRLSLDLNLQQEADSLLGDHSGALVLLNAQTGEILSLASHPYFDPNTLDANWNTWINDANAPLVNRATQGQYPPGTVLGPFLYAWLGETTSQAPKSLSLTVDGKLQTCSVTPQAPLTWETAIQAGCPGALASFDGLITASQIQEMFTDFGFYNQPNLRLPVATASPNEPVKDAGQAILGASGIQVSPLQMALAAATLSNHGVRPSPLLVISVQTPQQGWVVLPSDPSEKVITQSNFDATVSNLASVDLPVWETIGQASSGQKEYTWYVGGTLPAWNGQPLAIALVLEENNPDLAEQIGHSVLDAALSPAKQ